jgi:hypothetical protein
VSYVNSGRAGIVPVRRLHRRFFLPGRPATGTLHVAGYRGGDEPSFQLSEPRYIAARQTVSYRAKRLDKKPLPSGEFGAASLSIVPNRHLTGGNEGGNDCQMTFTHNLGGGWTIQLAPNGASTWPNDDWNPAPDPTAVYQQDAVVMWEADGHLATGCRTVVVWNVYPPINTPGTGGTVTFVMEWDWGSNNVQYSCTSTSPDVHCDDQTNAGFHQYELNYVTPTLVGRSTALDSRPGGGATMGA